MLAAVDIGSNGVRLLIKHAPRGESEPLFVKDLLVRVPLRLGEDVFEHGKIRDEKEEDLISLMKAYKHLMRVYGVEHYMVCATAAMREAKNADRIIEHIEDEVGFKVRVLCGEEEAQFIYGNHLKKLDSSAQDYLYVDVGGGSTELNHVVNGSLVLSQSLDVGTVRMLQGRVESQVWKKLDAALAKIRRVKGDRNITLVGSGGNINRLYRIARLPGGADVPFPLPVLEALHAELTSLSPSARAEHYNLREDRADVIVPAGSLFIRIARAVGAGEILVPTLGLADGIVQTLYDGLRAQGSIKKARI